MKSLLFVVAVVFGASSLLASLANAAEGAAAIRPADLRCEYAVDPLGIDAQPPRLSWRVEAVDPAARGLLQSAWQVQVASSPEMLAAGDINLWDSGKTNGADTLHIAYAGEALASRQPCYWRVRVWDGDGSASGWSAPAMWTMGLLNADDWTATWIGLDESEEEAAAPDANWIWFAEGQPAQSGPVAKRFFRRTFALPEGRQVARAVLQMAADNSGIALVNGVEVLRSNSFKATSSKDVTSRLNAGVDNVLAIVAENSGEAPNPAGLLAHLRIEFAEGDPLIIATDGEWLAREHAMAGWEGLPLDTSTWTQAMVLGKAGDAPWGEITQSHDRRLPARYVRREFGVEKEVVRATAYVCGLGYYEAFINGKKLGDAELAPALTDYRKRALYSTFDVKGHLKDGANAVGVALGNGRYYAPRGKDPFPTVTFGYPKLIFQMEIEFADGSVQQVLSDESWKLTADGPIRANNDYDGEDYDARMELGDWTGAGYDDSAWQNAERVEPLEGVLEAHMVNPIRVTKTLRPQTITEPQPGMFVLDMGQNMVGWIRFTVNAPEGTRIQLRHAEVVNDDGTINVANMRGAAVKVTYLCKGGGGPETYAPSFTYHGFRFVEVTGWPGTPTPDMFTGEVLHTDVEPAGDFACSNELINRIHQNIQWGVRGNLRSIPTDCPQRDERHGWLGDIAIEAKAQSYEFNTARFHAKWLDDIRLAQNEAGSVPDVAPPFWEMYNDNVTWPSTYPIIPGWFYTQYGDLRVIERHYPHLQRWIAHMNQYLDENGIMPRDTYGDWCVPPEDPQLIHSKDPARKAEGPLLGSTYFYHDLKLMESYAQLLGKDADAQDYAAQAERLKEAFNKAFLNDNSVYGKGTQTGQVLPLYFGMVPEGKVAPAFEWLVNSIMETNNGHIATGLVGGQWLMRVLSDNGRADVALTIATQEDYPSWGYMVKQGATTMWELWNGDTADPGMNSHNHLMLTGDLGLWFYEYLGGIRAVQPGFAAVEIMPYPVEGLTEARAHSNTVRGKVASHWRRDGDALVIDVETPPNTTARFALPKLVDARVTITESGKPVWQKGAYASGVTGITGAQEQGDRIVIEAGSGSYHFTIASEE